MREEGEWERDGSRRGVEGARSVIGPGRRGTGAGPGGGHGKDGAGPLTGRLPRTLAGPAMPSVRERGARADHAGPRGGRGKDEAGSPRG